jgi:hypothetical protein
MLLREARFVGFGGGGGGGGEAWMGTIPCRAGGRVELRGVLSEWELLCGFRSRSVRSDDVYSAHRVEAVRV